jgi:hypothetical protein
MCEPVLHNDADIMAGQFSSNCSLLYDQTLPVLKAYPSVPKAAVTFTITALSAIAIAYFAGPVLLRRNLELWELVLVGIASLIAVSGVMYVRNRRERRRLTDMQDSALW